MFDAATLRLQVKRTIRARNGYPAEVALNNYVEKAVAAKIKNRVMPHITAAIGSIGVDVEGLVEGEARKQTPFVDSALRTFIAVDTTPECIFSRDIMPDSLSLEKQIMEATRDGTLQNDIVQEVLGVFTPNDLTVCTVKIPMSSMKLSETTVVDAVGQVKIKLVKEYVPGATDAEYRGYDVLLWTEPVVLSHEGGGDDTIIDSAGELVSVLFHFKNKTNIEAPLHVIMSLSRDRKNPLSRLSSYDVSKAFGKVYGGEEKKCVIRVPVNTKEIEESIISKPVINALERPSEDGSIEEGEVIKEHTLVNASEPDDSLDVKLFIVRSNGSS